MTSIHSTHPETAIFLSHIANRYTCDIAVCIHNKNFMFLLTLNVAMAYNLFMTGF